MDTNNTIERIVSFIIKDVEMIIVSNKLLPLIFYSMFNFITFEENLPGPFVYSKYIFERYYTLDLHLSSQN